MKKPQLKTVFTVSALALMVGSIVLHERITHLGGLENLPIIKQAGTIVSARGWMQLSEYNRFIHMQGDISRGHNPSPGDINFAFQVAATHPNSSWSSLIQRTYAQEALVTLSSMPQTQEVTHRLYAMSVSSVSENNPTDAVPAEVILGNLKDKRAVPYLLPLINAQDKNVRECAVRSLHMMGVNAKPQAH